MQTPLRFFDCNASFGPRCIVVPGSFSTKEELLARMQRYHIDKALVHHAYARELDPQTGNARLMDEIANSPALTPAWVLMPHHTGEFDAPEAVAQRMQQRGVQAALLFPGGAHQCYSLRDYCCGPLLDMLAQRHVPLFLGFDQLGYDLDPLAALLQAHPTLQVVLTNVTYRIDRNLYPLMERYAGLHLETSGYKVQDGIEALCARFGAQRLLFGTGMPAISGSAGIGAVLYADLPMADKQKIAAENLERLLGGAWQ